MTDLISKEEAIKAVRKVCEKYDGVNDTYHPHIDFIEDALHNLSSIEKVGEWISCSERLPKEQGHYLVTARFKDKLVVMSDDYFTYGWDDFENEDVIAWMPLPTPYIERRKVIGE